MVSLQSLCAFVSLVFFSLCSPAVRGQEACRFQPDTRIPTHANPLDTVALVSPVATHARYSPAWSDPITNLPGDWVGAGSLCEHTASFGYLMGTAVLTAGLMRVDHQTYTASRRLYLRSNTVRRFSNGAVNIGGGMTQLGVAAAFGLYGAAAHDQRALRTGEQAVEAFFATGIAVQFLKRVAGRESPQCATVKTGIWRILPNPRYYQRDQPKYYSFPSGHIAATMATVTVLAENYPEEKWIRPIGYAAVGSVGFSLVNIRYHWYSDLPFGILLGHALGTIVSHRDHDDSGRDDAGRMKFSVGPSLGKDQARIALALSF